MSDFYKDSPAAFLPYLGDGATTFVWDRAPIIQYLQGVTDWTDTLSVVPSGAGYALVFRSPNDTWLSTKLDRGRSHFAVFQAPHAWYVGMEDATWDTRRTADWDYNDMIVRIPERDVPDGGGTLLLMAIGAGLCLWRRR